MVKHHREAELLRQAQHGHDVVVAVGVVMHDALALQHLDQCFLGEVAVGEFAVVALGGFGLAQVFLGGDEAIAHDRGGFPARARERRIALRVGAVRHLHAAQRPAIGVADQRFVDRAGV